jgi:uncharacterized protein (DUF2252 family)
MACRSSIHSPFVNNTVTETKHERNSTVKRVFADGDEQKKTMSHSAGDKCTTKTARFMSRSDQKLHDLVADTLQ